LLITPNWQFLQALEHCTISLESESVHSSRTPARNAVDQWSLLNHFTQQSLLTMLFVQLLFGFSANQPANAGPYSIPALSPYSATYQIIGRRSHVTHPSERNISSARLPSNFTHADLITSIADADRCDFRIISSRHLKQDMRRAHGLPYIEASHCVASILIAR